ncbi:MAG: OadG family transporter subunit [Trueperaceae bacterium]
MDQPALWMLSISAFTAVMLLLGILSAAIWLLTVAFAAPPPPAAASVVAQSAPPAAGDADAPTLAAIHAAVQRLLPGGRVTHVSALPGPSERGEEAR